MDNVRFRVARWVMNHRLFTALAFLVITAVFATGLPNVQLKTIFSDLLPADDPFVQVFQDHPNFGNPLTVTVMIQRKDGDIYNTETLRKVWQFTRDIDLTPGVDHDQILSISTEKARYAEATPFGIDMRPLMGDEVPETEEEIADFRNRVNKSPGVANFLISRDETATLINATFIEHKLDYGVAFEFVQNLVEEARDENHDVYLAGQPALTGWVYRYEKEMFSIFAVTLGGLVLFLLLYMRNIVGVVTPIVVSGVAAIWGFGLTGLVQSPIEPLLMIVPLLLVARSFSHCVQFTERYYEIYAEVPDRKKAAELTMGVMMAPSLLGMITDTAGLFIIAIAPIPAMERFALFCGFWALFLIPTGVFLISLLLSALPEPRNVAELTGHGGKASPFMARFQAFLVWLGSLTHHRRARVTTAVLAVATVGIIYQAFQIKIGNPVEGSNLLWQDSQFNTAVRNINDNFPGMNTLELVLESKDPDSQTRAARQAETVLTAFRLQQALERTENAPRATLSYGDYLLEGNRLFSGGNPKWLSLDPDNRAVNAAATAVMLGTSSKAFSHVADFRLQHSTVSLWYPDNKQETVDGALASAREVVDKIGTDFEGFRVRLGTGTIALQQAMNSVVERYHWIVIGLLNLVILLLATYAYKSPVAALVLMIPVNLSNITLQATMHTLGIGLDINSMMVAAIGVGVGIDYGIYLLSRICEEYHEQNGDWGQAIDVSLKTTGKAIMFTATIMLISIVPWYFLAGLKFMADMGLLLTMVMLINMTLALVVLPLLVWLIKPKFVQRTDLMVGESLDLSQLGAEYRIVGKTATPAGATA